VEGMRVLEVTMNEAGSGAILRGVINDSRGRIVLMNLELCVRLGSLAVEMVSQTGACGGTFRSCRIQTSREGILPSCAVGLIITGPRFVGEFSDYEGGHEHAYNASSKTDEDHGLPGIARDDRSILELCAGSHPDDVYELRMTPGLH